jgi:hypothetical protein
MATLFGIIAVVLTIAIIFGRRVARWVVISGLCSVVLIAGVFFAYFWWCDWSSGRMELSEITNRLLDEQMKYNLPLDEEVPLWRVQELAKETQSEMHKRHIFRLASDQVTRIMQYEEARWKSWLDSPEKKLEMWRSYRKNLGDVVALQFLKPEDKELLKQHPELLTNEERRFLEQGSTAKIGS